MSKSIVDFPAAGRQDPFASLLPPPAIYESTKRAYNRLHSAYNSYADGNVHENLFNFLDPRSRQYAYEDLLVWEQLCAWVDRHISTGAREVTVLDVGCGQGTWPFRLAVAYGQHGIQIRATGFDLGESLIADAQRNLAEYRRRYPALALDLNFEVGDVTEVLPFKNGEFHLVTSLNTVMNHVCREDLPAAIAELLRVTKGVAFVTLKGPGSAPTAYVCSLDNVKVEQKGDRALLTWPNGERRWIQSTLLSCEEWRKLFEAVGEVKDIVGLDIVTTRCLHNRFSREPLPQDDLLMEQLHSLDAKLCRREEFVDVANHVLIVTAPTNGYLRYSPDN